MKCCTLTTPIFLYRLDAGGLENVALPKHSKNVTVASEELVRQMWRDFQKWRSADYSPGGGDP